MENEKPDKDATARHYSRTRMPVGTGEHAGADGDKREPTKEQEAAREEAKRVAQLPPLTQTDIERKAQEETLEMREEKAKGATGDGTPPEKIPHR